MPYEITRTRRASDPPSRIPTLADRVDVALGEIEDTINNTINGAGGGAESTVTLRPRAGNTPNRDWCYWPEGTVILDVEVVADVEHAVASGGDILMSLTSYVAGTETADIVSAFDLGAAQSAVDIAGRVSPTLTGGAATPAAADTMLKAQIYTLGDEFTAGDASILIRFAPPSS